MLFRTILALHLNRDIIVVQFGTNLRGTYMMMADCLIRHQPYRPQF